MTARTRGPLRRLVTIAIVIAVVAAIGLVIHGRSAAGDPEAAGANAPGGGNDGSIAQSAPTVAVMRVTRRDLRQTTVLTSELDPYEIVKLYAKEAGYLKSIDVDYGSHVSAGETLATLELPEQEADLERSGAAFDLAKADYERVATVNRESPGLIAQADVDKARADYLMARDQQQRASVVEGYSTIVAPFDGVVTKRYVDPGALIEQGTTSSTALPIVEVAETNRLRLVVETPETLVPLINVGLPVTVKIAATGETMAASVSRYSYDLHADTRTMHTEVDVANADLHLKPGMYATATFVVASKADAIVAPTQAVSKDTPPTAWVVGSDDTLRARTVTLGLQTPDYVQVTSGLEPGDLVFIGDRTSYELGAHVHPKLVSAPRV